MKWSFYLFPSLRKRRKFSCRFLLLTEGKNTVKNLDAEFYYKGIEKLTNHLNKF